MAVRRALALSLFSLFATSALAQDDADSAAGGTESSESSAEPAPPEGESTEPARTEAESTDPESEPDDAPTISARDALETDDVASAAPTGRGDTTGRATPAGPTDPASGVPNAEPAPVAVLPDAAPEVEPETDRLRVSPIGFVRIGFTHVQRDTDLGFVGANNGFAAANVRGGVDLHHESGIGARVSLEGAADLSGELNDPRSTLSVSVRDAFARYRCRCGAFEVRIGQTRPPFSGEEARSSGRLRFIDRAVGENGVQVGRGLQLRGMDIRRQLGLYVGTAEPLAFGPVRLFAAGMIANGNGENQLLNDNRRYAYHGRLAAGLVLGEARDAAHGERVRDHVTVGLGGYRNDRTVGALPDLFDEVDRGLAADVLLELHGFDLYAQVLRVTTELPTIGAETRTNLAFHAQAAYDLSLPRDLVFGPAYRYAMWRPWHGGGGEGTSADLSDYQLQEHTLGVRLRYPMGWAELGVYVEYTFAVEDEARELTNDRVQALVQVVL